MRDRRHRVGRSLSILLSGALIGQLATLAAAPVLGRIYSPTEFGVFAVYVSLVAIGAVISTLRYEMAMVLPRSGQEALAVRQVALRLLFFGSALTEICLVAVAVAIPDFPSEWVSAALLSGPGVFASGYLAIMTLWHTRLRSFPALSRSRAALGVATGIAQIAVHFLQLPGGTALIIGLLLGQAVSSLFLRASDRATHGMLTSVRRAHVLRKYWRMPALQMPQALIDSVRVSGINLVVGTFSIGALGQYAQAWRLVTVPSGLVSSALSQIYYPELATANRKEMFRVVVSSVWRALVFGFIPFTLLFILSPFVIPWALGGEWQQAGLIAQALTPWLYLNLATSPVSTAFIVLDRQTVGLAFAVVYAIAPIVVLLSMPGNLLVAVIAMSVCQSLLLIVNLCLVLLMTARAARN